MSLQISQRVQVVGDFVCPWCFIGKRKLDHALQGADADEYSVEWLPFELDPSIPGDGAERLGYRTRRFGSAERSMEKDRNATLAGAAIGIEFRYGLMNRVPNTFNAHRLVWWAGMFNGPRGKKQGDVVEALFRAYFQQGRDIGQTSTLLEIAAELDLGEGDAARLLNSDSGVEGVRSLERWVRDQSVVTVPSYILNRGGLTQGLDSLISNIN